MKTFYRGFTIKTTMMKGARTGSVLWLIYSRKGIIQSGNKPILKGMVHGNTAPVFEFESSALEKYALSKAQAEADALLSGCRIIKKGSKWKPVQPIQLTPEQINQILTDELFHLVSSRQAASSEAENAEMLEEEIDRLRGELGKANLHMDFLEEENRKARELLERWCSKYEPARTDFSIVFRETRAFLDGDKP